MMPSINKRAAETLNKHKGKVTRGRGVMHDCDVNRFAKYVANELILRRAFLVAFYFGPVMVSIAQL